MSEVNQTLMEVMELSYEEISYLQRKKKKKTTGIPRFPRFQFKAVYNSILFSSPLVLLGNLNTRFFLLQFFICVPTLTA